MLSARIINKHKIVILLLFWAADSCFILFGGELMEIRCALCGKKLEINKMDKNFEAVRAGKNPVIICDMCQRSARYEAKKQVEKI